MLAWIKNHKNATIYMAVFVALIVVGFVLRGCLCK